MLEKKELKRQYQAKQEQIKLQREYGAQLQKTKRENEEAIAALNHDNKSIIEQGIPLALQLVQIKAGPSNRLNLEDKQAVLDYAQKQMATLSVEEERTKSLYNKTSKFNELLKSVAKHLKTGYSKEEVTRLVNQSGVSGSASAQNKGFALLLELLGETLDKYTWTLDSTDRRNLSDAVSKKLASLVYPLSVDEQSLREFSSASRALGTHQLKLTSNYEEKEKLATTVMQLSQQITQIDSVTIKELTEQAAELERQIGEIEQQEELERQQNLARQQELLRQQLESQQELARQQEPQIPAQRPDIQENLAMQENVAKQQAMAQRGTLTTTVMQMLKTYQKEREDQYLVKDFFTSEDKDNRDIFIGELVNEENGLLKTYVENGNNDAVLDKITTSMDKFPGVKMQAVLNRIVVMLMDADSKPEAVENLHQQATQALSTLQRKDERHRQYALKMRRLYKNITDIEAYAETLPEHENGIMKQLAADLRNDIEHFIYQNRTGMPEKEAYQKFEMKFKARLHSHDDVMSEHKSWPVIIASFVFNLVTTGKLIYSNEVIKRAIFFCDEAETQKESEAPADEALEDIRNLFNTVSG
ncbi:MULTISPECIES: hypothetical protein [Legionella]|uniref:hypothetical protein n=1 Tax=Legionella TaxID=445 RepID=UPI00095E1543|nr:MULTISPECIES: hypothetical protein [Legionella]MBN9227098.1 hypothetical protein [Legionella steelei]OJW07337.1 MAG: hypothetical protein BGO44_17095 [Legionella sp. 39-23]